MTTSLVYGLGVVGRAVAEKLISSGQEVVLADDAHSENSEKFVREIGAQFFHNPDTRTLEKLLDGVNRLVPAPGIAESHRVIGLAKKSSVPIWSELELAYQFEQKENFPRQIVAITGTDGKTTTTLMVTAILQEAGLRAQGVGNTQTPLISALGSDTEVFVVECSSFSSANIHTFRAESGAWLNFAQDHLDWHSSIDSYFHAKENLWRFANNDDIAVMPFGDHKIRESANSSQARCVSFGLDSGDYSSCAGILNSPHGKIMEAKDLQRSLPHDVKNALAASALTIESGLATCEEAARALAKFQHAPHRIELVAKHEGIAWYNDSKATSPHATSVALASFASIILIAGGKNKGLDLSKIAGGATGVRAVIAIGEAKNDIAAAFLGKCEVQLADSMRQAVRAAGAIARSGDVVLLSPGCTSYDWYSNYAQRGVDFTSEVIDFLKSRQEKEN